MAQNKLRGKAFVPDSLQAYCYLMKDIKRKLK